MTYAERATQYARDVVDGRVLACRYVQLACQRHLDDLERGDDYPYYFDAEAADRPCKTLEALPHVKGKWARGGGTIELEDWQCFLVCVPFGWLKKKDHTRRFRRTYIEVPRKNAKSTVSAGLGLYMLCFDKEIGAEVYCGATTEAQAWEVFRPAKWMAERTPALRSAASLEVNAKTLVVPASGSRFAPVIGKPGDGASPSFSITDEYHEHATEEQYDTMVTGMLAREQPMSWVITTAGSDTSGPCYSLREDAIRMLEGRVEEPDFFAIVYTIDEGDDWTAELALRKANPNYGVSVNADQLQADLQKAINNPRKQSTFKTKHLNVWVGAAAPYFNLEKWNRLADTSLMVEQFRGEPVWLGVDLAAKLDITAVVRLFKREIDNETHYYCFPRLYLPEEQVDRNKAYGGWVAQGHLTATSGNITDYDVIEADILADHETFRIVEAGFDPWNATQFATHLGNAGIEAVEIPQSVKHLSDPMKWVQALIEDGRLHHDGNPCMAWMIGNVTAREDANSNVHPLKDGGKNSNKKIDGPVALIMAMGRAFQIEEPGSYLEDGDLIVL